MEMDSMIFILSTLINLICVSVMAKVCRAIARERFLLRHELHAKLEEWAEFYQNRVNAFGKKAEKELRGRANEVVLTAKLAEKMADRAFNMASSANLGVIALQKSLAQPRLMTKHQTVRNELAKNEVDKLFTTEGSFDFLRPILSDEENDLLDEMEKHNAKNGNGN